MTAISGPLREGTPTLRATWRLAQVLTLVLVAGCGPTATSTPMADERSPAPPNAHPAAPSPEHVRSTIEALPFGLAPRSGLPPLTDGEVAACVPGCGVGRVAGGAMPNGRYQTRWFFGGSMTLETDDAWSLREDSNGELAIFLPGDTAYAVAFWLDPEPYLHGRRVAGVGSDADAFLDWLASRPDLVVSAPRPASIGAVPARTVDIRLAASAGQDEPDCGADPCISFIRNPAFDHVGGILGDDDDRFIFADVTYAGTDHLLVAMVEGRDAPHLRSVIPATDALLRTVTIPARPARCEVSARCGSTR
jgi:hypothetical protein